MTESLPINQVIEGDCLKVLEDFPQDSIDIAITSPPYKNAYEGIGINKSEKTAKFHYTGDFGEPLYIVEDLAPLLKEILKEEGVFFLNLGYNQDSGALRPFYIVNRFIKRGWFCPETIIWHKDNPIPNTAYQLTNSFEYVFCLSQRPRIKMNVEDREYVHNVFEIPIASDTNKKHSAAFPKELPKKIIELFSDEGDVILDPFLGTGTTAVAAKELGRKYVGIEINNEYCKMARERLKQETVEGFV